jgi:hypothetical protein
MSDVLTQMGSVLGGFLESPGVQLAGRSLLTALLILWLAAAVWIHRDLRRRVSNPVVPYVAAGMSILATPVLAPLVLIAYRMVRPPLIADEEERSLAMLAIGGAARAEASCPRCAARVDPAWRSCPHCRTQLSQPCPRCAKPVARDWTICPWCVLELPDSEASRRQPPRPEAPVTTAREVRAARHRHTTAHVSR